MDKVASGIMPDVEGGHLAARKERRRHGVALIVQAAFALGVVFPPGWKLGSTSGRMPDATVSDRHFRSHRRGRAALILSPSASGDGF